MPSTSSEISPIAIPATGAFSGTPAFINPIEEAQALVRLKDEFELTHEEVAQAVGKSRTAVTNLMRLMALDAEVRKLLDEAHDEALEILTRHRDAMERMVEALLERETVGPDEMAEIFADVPKWEHSDDGMRVRFPLDPQPHPATQAAMEEADEEPASTTREVTVKAPSPRTSSRPADAGA